MNDAISINPTAGANDKAFPPNRKRLFVTVLTGLAALSLILVAQNWFALVLRESAGVPQEHAVTGLQTHPALMPLAVAAVICSLILGFTRRYAFYFLSGLLVILASLAVILSAGILTDSAAALSGYISELTAISGGGQLDFIDSLRPTIWVFAYVFITGGLTLLACLGFLLSRNWNFSTKTSKYDSYSKADSVPVADTEENDENDYVSDWDALGRGTDPTLRD